MVIPTPLRPGRAGPEGAPAKAAAADDRIVFGPLGIAAGPRLRRSEREFLPALLEVIETPASPTLRLSAWAICALIVIALTWACLAHIDMVAVAEGKVVPLGQVKVVQPLETAVIRAIHVEEGDHVFTGQLLVELDPTEARADLDALVYNRNQAALDVEVTRILLTRNPFELFRAPAGADPVLADQGRSQAQREIEKHLAAVAAYEADIAQKRATFLVNEAQIERARLIIPLVAEKHETAQTLWDKRFGARPPVLDTKQQLVEKQAELKAAQHRRLPDRSRDPLAGG